MVFGTQWWREHIHLLDMTFSLITYTQAFVVPPSQNTHAKNVAHAKFIDSNVVIWLY